MGPNTKKNGLKILFVASEAAPLIQVGGLGGVLLSLPKALRSLGCDVRTMIPKYATIDTKLYPLFSEAKNIEIETTDHDPYHLLISNVLRHKAKDGSIIYLFENMEYFEKRANVYGYADDTARWVLLSKGTLEFIRRSSWKPDIIVASDWQTGFIPNLMRTEYKDDPILSKITVIFSIHNLKYQGLFDPRFVAEMDFDAGQSKIPNFFDKAIIKLNGMRRGIKYADVVNTVSPTYAKEIITEDFGEKLDKLLSERKNCLFGILNGIDTTSWNPENDKIIEFNYSKNNFENRFKNKVVLQRRFGLPTDKNKFVVGMVSRLSSQKGFDLIEKSLESLMDNLDFQFIIVGEGDSRYRKFFEDLKKKYPHRIGGHYVFDSILPRLIFAGADAVLIPSKYEPSGLTQMEAMRYGCVPIVRKVGGLADTVDDFNPSANNTGTGFVFKKYDSFALSVAFVRAYEIHKQTKEWRKIAIKGMKKDFSWKKSAREYIKIFSLAMHLHQKAKKHSS